MPPHEPHWQALGLPDVIAEEIDFQVFCYVYASAETHYLSAFPGEVYTALLDNKATKPLLAQSLAKRFEVNADDHWQRQVDGVVDSLAKLGLVKTVQ